MFRSCIILLLVISGENLHGQTSNINPWQPTNAARATVYHPDPILFVHGVDDNDNTGGDVGLLGWNSAAIPAVNNYFTIYDLPMPQPTSLVLFQTSTHDKRPTFTPSTMAIQSSQSPGTAELCWAYNQTKA